ncbi:MAG: PDZ domain-containing protein [Planctomycetaceae bacterium]|nr:PDZ domain-containing protein [Planctomycetaceae bacterium]
MSAVLTVAVLCLSLSWPNQVRACSCVQSEEVDAPHRLAHEGRLRELMETIQANHIQPPTRQQLILEVVKAFATKQKSSVPTGFSAKLSEENSPDRLYALMTDELARTGATTLPDDQFDSIALTALAESTEGGLAVIRQKDKNVNEQLAANRYVGIGIQVGVHRDTKETLIIKAIEGGTAEQAGVKDQDIIESVDGRATKDVPLNQVVDWLRGPEGTTTKVTIRNQDGSKEMEIVRRVTPFKTVQMIQDDAHPNVVLLRPDRIGASTVNELSTLVSPLPESVKTIAVDLRFTTSASIHHLHLLADALIDASTIGAVGSVESRKERRDLRLEPGTFADGRTIALVYIPSVSSRIDWLAAVASGSNIPVYHEEPWKEIPGTDPPAAVPGTLESFPVWNGTYFVEMNASRLLLADGQSARSLEPFGVALMATADSSGGLFATFSQALTQPVHTPPAPNLMLTRPPDTPTRRMTPDSLILKKLSESLEQPQR